MAFPRGGPRHPSSVRADFERKDANSGDFLKITGQRGRFPGIDRHPPAGREVIVNVGRLVPVPLAVTGAALLVAAVHAPGGHAAVAMSAASAYVPPVTTVSVELARPVRVLPTRPRHPHRPTSRRPAPHPAPERTAPAAVHPAGPSRPAAQPVKHVATPYVSGPTRWSALNAAIEAIPTYRSGAARWVVSTKYDFWGTADWYHDVLYVDPSVPTEKLYDVAVHEWSHELSVLDYGGDVAAATRAMNATFGGRGLTGAERAADCMAILQGAGWTHYTTCADAGWRAAAARLVAGKRLL
jgi:hypothetical protein